MNENLSGFAWNLYTELRKELISLQAIRAQVIGFKIAFVCAGVPLISANLDKLSPLLFVVPAFASIFFDLLAHSYSYSIKRTGFYCRKTLEPILRKEYDFPSDRYLWEEFLTTSATNKNGRFLKKLVLKNVPFWGQLGLTILAVITAIIAMFFQYNWIVSILLFIVLVGFLVYDVIALYKPTLIPELDIDRKDAQ
jgi:hypothetical protein